MDHASSSAPAKLNLFLYVTGQRDDGYHDILTLMQKVSLYDRIDLSLEPGEAIRIRTTAQDLPLDDRNTVYRAIQLFFGNAPVPKKQVTVDLEKNIPVEAGMGGASSDAACVLRLLNGLIPAYRDPDLTGIAGRIGSDVPFFMMEGSGLASGRGDIVKSVGIEGPLHYVVVKPGFGISTRRAYSLLKPLTKTGPPSMCDLAFYTKHDIIRCLQNDLEAVTEEHASEIHTIKEKLLQAGAYAAAMTGSGSCVFGIFFEDQEAQKALNKMSKDYTTVYKLHGI
jgi:4-diphosphocytidyl-2-C-methyl-D-erythritol kinase